MADEKVNRKEDCIVDGVDYSKVPFIGFRSHCDAFDEIRNDGYGLILSNNPDAAFIRKWIRKKCELHERKDFAYELHHIASVIFRSKENTKVSKWDKQTKEEREARVKRNIGALRIILKELKEGEFYPVYNENILGFQMVDNIGLGTLSGYEDRGVVSLQDIFIDVLGYAKSREDNIEKRFFKGVSHKNIKMCWLVRDLVREFTHDFGEHVEIEGVIASCIRLAYPEELENITRDLVAKWVLKAKESRGFVKINGISI